MAKVFSIISTKGGVGKTTLAANLGGILADMNQRALLVDTDDQSSLSDYYPLTHRAAHGLKAFVTHMGETQGCISTAVPTWHTTQAEVAHG